MIRRLWPVAAAFALAGCTLFQSNADKAPAYIVFFHYDSTSLTPEAQHIVDAAAGAVRDTKPSAVALAGYTEQTAAPSSRPLAKQRFDAVANALIADGVDPQMLARVPLADMEASLPSTADRGVEIRLLHKTQP
jgi:flagellar motor protein MotB